MINLSEPLKILVMYKIKETRIIPSYKMYLTHIIYMYISTYKYVYCLHCIYIQML